MNTMFNFLDRIQIQKEPGPEQYLGEDGLIYCGKCHTPVQCRITFEGRERIMPCICKCQKEEREQQEQRMKEEEQLLYVRRLKAAGIQERHLQDWTFASATDTPSVQMAKRYTENWKKVKAENLGLLLWGDIGTGKSFLAACIANELLEKGVPVLMTNFSKILNQMGAMYSGSSFSPDAADEKSDWIAHRLRSPWHGQLHQSAVNLRKRPVRLRWLQKNPDWES